MKNIIILALFLCACPKPGPEPGYPPVTPGGVISCAVTAVQQHAPEVLPKVNECLIMKVGAVNCLIGLIQPAIGITLDVIACVTAHEGDAAGAAAALNPRDSIDVLRHKNAEEFIQSQNIQFAH